MQRLSTVIPEHLRSSINDESISVIHAPEGYKRFVRLADVLSVNFTNMCAGQFPSTAAAFPASGQIAPDSVSAVPDISATCDAPKAAG